MYIGSDLAPAPETDPIMTFHFQDKFSVVLHVDTGIADITIYDSAGVHNPLFTISVTDVWTWSFAKGSISVIVHAIIGNIQITYYNAWWISLHGVIFDFIWLVYDGTDIEIKGIFQDDYFIFELYWMWFILVTWYWEELIYWECEIILDVWIIEWTLMRNKLTNPHSWEWRWSVYYYNWILPFVMFEVPLVTIDPIVRIQILDESYDIETNLLQIRYQFVDIYGNIMSVLSSSASIGLINDLAEHIENGIYLAEFTVPYSDSGWNIHITAEINHVALVEDLQYNLQIEEYCTECPTCSECPACPTWDITKSVLIGTTTLGFLLAGVFLILGRRGNGFICPTP